MGKCSTVEGPGGALITQDIKEDVVLGPETKKYTVLWDRAFKDCVSQGSSCNGVFKGYRPILQSVQRGLSKLLNSSSCQKPGELQDIMLFEEDFVDCTIKGKFERFPAVTYKLEAISRQVRSNLPAKALEQFPLNDVVRWIEPMVKLPPEEEDEEDEEDEDEEDEEGEISELN